MSDRVVASVDPAEFLFAVVAMGEGRELLHPVIYGTAFCIGPGIFVTAGHVISMVEGDGGAVAIARPGSGGAFRMTRASAVEQLGYDVGLIAAPQSAPALLEWSTSRSAFLADVSAMGFPYAVTVVSEPPSFKVTMRAFKGSIMTRTALWKLDGEPAGYEISCPFPKGMSGAPLLDATPPIPELRVIGLVLASSEVEALEETTRFGVALDVLEMRRLHSPMIIGGTLDELRSALLTGDIFEPIPGRPFLEWPRGRRRP